MKKTHLLFIFIAFISQSCVNLEHINSFSAGAVGTLASYNDIDYTYTSGYQRYALTQKDYEFNPGDDFTKNKFSLPQRFTLPGEPETALKADKAISFFFNSLGAYFQSLANISDKDLINYNFDEIANNLKADEKLKTAFGGITDNQIDASSRIGKVLTDEIMKAYRASKIKKVIIAHDGDVSAAITALVKILSGPRLRVLAYDKGLLDTKYQAILLDPRVDTGTKIRLREKYLTEQAELDNYKIQIENLTAALQQIKSEHHVIADLLKSNKIDAPQIKENIKKYSGIIRELIDNIKNLKQS